MKRPLLLRHLPHLLITGTALLFHASLALGAGPGDNLSPAATDERRCLEVSSGDFFVEECVQWTSRTALRAELDPAMPDAMLNILGAELQWRESYLRQAIHNDQTTGRYSRWARWQDQDLRRLGSHSFATERGWNGRAVFALEISHHRVQSVHAEYDPRGNGSLEISFADGGGLREVIFEEGRVISDREPRTQNAGSFYMGCYIDTPAYDVFRPDYCATLGSRPSTAVFKVFLPYTPQSVVWVSPNASCSNIWCSVPISPGQTKSGYAYWVINNTPTGPVSATARYYFEPGF